MQLTTRLEGLSKYVCIVEPHSSDAFQGALAPGVKQIHRAMSESPRNTKFENWEPDCGMLNGANVDRVVGNRVGLREGL